MTIDLQRRTEELRAPNGRGCPNGLRRDDDIVALLDALENTTAICECNQRNLNALMRIAQVMCEPGTITGLGSIAEEPIDKALPHLAETVWKTWKTTERDEAEVKLVVAKKVIEAARWAMLAVLDPDSDPIAAEELVRAMAEWDALSYPVRVEEEREKLRQECHADLDALRTDSEMPERAFRLLEKLVARLDRIETGSFHETESPTKPERRHSATWSNEGVMKALEKGRKKDDE
jgi:hypothetical protein